MFGKQIGIRFEARLLFVKTGLVNDDAEASSKLLTDNDVCKQFFSLDVKMARFGMELQDTSKKKFRSATEVAREFVDAFREAFPGANVKEYEKAWFANETTNVTDVAPAASACSKAAPATGSSSVSQKPGSSSRAEKPGSSAKAGPSVGLYEVDMTGKTIDGMARLRAAGFEMGHEVAGEDGEVWEIEGVESDSPGSFSVICVRAENSKKKDGPILVRRVALDTFLTEWKAKKAKNEVKLHKGWPENRTVIRQCTHLRGPIGIGASC